ncbi:hypothetical protein PZB74_10450 [Porifericola rhodea]|uniref:hypothetical protein n=1 Tax=Porifericola rhodea TaxID=930972 RepID=UPI002664ED6B|nr:hypothetical protein [Porifericola rhodea]WKN33745.1 hypothetical protein PZB74_10450 [Porifericola rhodea]
MRFFILTTCWFLCYSLNIFAQNEGRVIWGIVKELPTYQAVPIVNIQGGIKGAYTNVEGEFSLRVIEGDTLSVTHINYYPLRLILNEEDEDTIQIFLFARENTLKELVIRGLPSEEKFVNDLLEHRGQKTSQELLSEKNTSLAHAYFLIGYVPEMDGVDNHKWYVAGPRMVTFFSSGPSKGILRAFKNIDKDYASPTLKLYSSRLSQVSVSRFTTDSLHRSESQGIFLTKDK